MCACAHVCMCVTQIKTKETMNFKDTGWGVWEYAEVGKPEMM